MCCTKCLSTRNMKRKEFLLLIRNICICIRWLCNEKCGIYVTLQRSSIVRRSPQSEMEKKAMKEKLCRVDHEYAVLNSSIKRCVPFECDFFRLKFFLLLHSVLFHRFCSSSCSRRSRYWMAFKTPNNNHIRCFCAVFSSTYNNVCRFFSSISCTFVGNFETKSNGHKIEGKYCTHELLMHVGLQLVRIRCVRSQAPCDSFALV